MDRTFRSRAWLPAVLLGLAAGCSSADPVEPALVPPWPADCAALVAEAMHPDGIAESAHGVIASWRPLQIGVARIVGRDEGAASVHLPPGAQSVFLHDPLYTEATWHVATPTTPLREGQVRRVVLQCLILLGLPRLRRLALAGPEVDALTTAGR